MPSRNSRKIYLQDAYYHLYNRGLDKQSIFLDADDYAVFLNLLKRYLDKQPAKDNKGRQYPWLHEDVELLAFCLMPNHFHLLVYQLTDDGVRQLLKNICGSYTTYFNKKYKRIGPLFQDRFKASMITRDDYLQHISRYIHLNPKTYKAWEFSSLPYYLGKKQAGWVRPDKILDLFNGRDEYAAFVSDYEAQKAMIDDIKAELAHT